jgi:uncharacterized repeat protein (TIGR03987 family)
MPSILVISIICMILALTLYTIGVWSERFAGRLKPWHLLFFWAGLIFDTTGTTLMGIMAGSMKFDFHGITGALAIILMLGHAIWATIAIVMKQEKVLVNFHKFSLVVWVLWLIPFVSGLAGAMLR